MSRSPIAARARAAARASMREDLLAALEEHAGDLDQVASDPRVGCDRRNLYHYARQAGVDLAALAAERRQRDSER